jgi:hypothetical protein
MIVWCFNRQLPVPSEQLACYTNQIGSYCFGFPLPKRLATTHDGHPAQRVVSPLYGLNALSLGLFDAWLGKLGIFAFLSKNLVKHYF